LESLCNGVHLDGPAGETLDQVADCFERARQGWFRHCLGGRFSPTLLTLQVALHRIEKEPVMWYRVPIKDLLFLLGPNAIVAVQHFQERRLGFFEAGIRSGLEVAQVREHTLLKLLDVAHRSSKALETRDQRPHNVGACDVVQLIPEHTRDRFACWQLEPRELHLICWCCG